MKTKNLKYFTGGYMNTDGGQMNVDTSTLLEDPHVNFLLSAYEENPSVLQDPEFAQVLTPILKALGREPAATQTDGDNPIAGDPTAGNPAGGNPTGGNPAGKSNTRQTDGGQTVVVMDGEEDFMKGEGLFKKKEVDYSKINNQNFERFVQVRHGIDTSKEDWISTFAKSVDTHRANATLVQKAKTEVETIKSNLNNLPLSLAVAINRFMEGGDWKSAINEYEIDYNKDWNNFDFGTKLELAKKLIPNITLPESSSETDVLTQTVLNSAGAVFNVNKEKVKSSIESATLKEQQRINNLKTDIEASIEALSSEFPDEFSEEDLNEIREVFLQGVGSLFFDRNGKLYKDAAKRLIFVKHGQSLIDRFATNKATKKTNEQVIQMIGTQQSRGGGSNTQSITPQESPEVKELSALFNSYKSIY